MHDSFWTDGKMRDKHQFIIETTTHLQPPLEQAQPQVEYAASPGSASSQFPTQLRGTDYPSAQADHPNISQGHDQPQPISMLGLPDPTALPLPTGRLEIPEGQLLPHAQPVPVSLGWGIVGQEQPGFRVLRPPLSHGPTPQPTRLSGDQTGKRHLLTLGQPQMHLALHSHQVIPPQSLDFLQQLWAGAQAPIRLYQDWSVGRNSLGHPAQQGGDQFHLPKGPSFLMIAPPSQGNGSPAIGQADCHHFQPFLQAGLGHQQHHQRGGFQAAPDPRNQSLGALLPINLPIAQEALQPPLHRIRLPQPRKGFGHPTQGTASGQGQAQAESSQGSSLRLAQVGHLFSLEFGLPQGWRRSLHESTVSIISFLPSKTVVY